MNYSFTKMFDYQQSLLHIWATRLDGNYNIQLICKVTKRREIFTWCSFSNHCVFYNDRLSGMQQNQRLLN